MTINEAVAQFIATLTFWHIIILIVVMVICLIAYVRIANVQSWSFRGGFKYYPDKDARRAARRSRRRTK